MKVLLIEDNRNYAFLVESMLRRSSREPLSFTWAETLRAGIDHLRRDAFDVTLADLSLPDSAGLATVTELKNQAGLTPIVVLTGCHDERLAAEALRHGAQDYLLKNEIDRHGLERTIRYAIERQRSEDKYRDLVESLDTIVWEANPGTWQFTFVSKAAEKILGYPVANWLQSADFWVNLIHPDDRSTAVEYCRRQCEVGDAHEFEYRAVAQDGRIVWLRDIVRVIRNERGQAVSLRGVMIDISQTKQAAAELQRHHYEIESLQEISQVILEAAEPNGGIEKALEKSIAAGGFDFGDVLLTTPQGELISVAAAWGFNDPANLQRNQRPESSTHRSEQLQQSVIRQNIQSGERFRSLKKDGAETAVVVPLRAGNESLGLLQLASRRAREVCSSELALAEAMGRQIGIAIQKAKLTEELQTNLRRIQALHDSNVAVTSTLDLRAVLNILLEKIDTFPDPGAALVIRLVDCETGRIEFFASRNLDEGEWIRQFGAERTISYGGLPTQALENKTPMVIQDLCTDPRVRHSEFFRRQRLFSYLGVPLRIQERPVGVVGIYTRMPYEFSADEINSITSLASHAAVAIHNARLYAEIDKKSQEISALLDVTSSAGRSLDIHEVLRDVAKKLTEIFDFNTTRVLLVDQRTQELHVRASYTTHEDFSLGPTTYMKGQGISARVAATGEAVVIENIDTDPRYEKLSHARIAVKVGQKFAASFPIKYQAEILGVINCMGRQPRRLSDHELRLMTSMSNQIAVAVHNARLYSEVEKQSRELSALFEVTAAATQSLEMDRVLEEVIRRINEIFSFDATRFYLFDEQQEQLHCRASHEVDPKFTPRTVTFKKGQGITGHVGATGTALIVENTQDNPSYQSLSQAHKGGARFVAGFPVKYGSQTLGVIMCMGEHPRWLSKHEIELIESLSSQIAIAITNARLYEQTKKQTEQLRSLATHLETVREQERTRISRELHDELGQALTGLKFDAAWVSARLSDSESSLVARLATMSESLDNTIQTIRQISARLRPDILDKLGLSAAVEWQLQEFRRRSGINYHFNSHPTDIRLHEQPSIALFRILQEALTNVARHSQASRVRVAIEQQAQEVSLQVDDNGCGIEDDKLVGGQSLGLLGMRERATSLGGSVTIRRNGEQGTVVTAVVPIQLGSNELDFSPGRQEL